MALVGMGHPLKSQILVFSSSYSYSSASASVSVSVSVVDSKSVPVAATESVKLYLVSTLYGIESVLDFGSGFGYNYDNHLYPYPYL